MTEKRPVLTYPDIVDIIQHWAQRCKEPCDSCPIGPARCQRCIDIVIGRLDTGRPLFKDTGN